ncbi:MULTISPECIES: hypothetical protein [Novacetimonas]|uniref:Uncharacterized protein n=1 Tax=Novacetimonas hansenii TaxID=436 RepID=A0AAW5ESI2_NOVHA|nr:hypothetical protein [Novacetimonas hansenii]MCJ8354474.1 hypothetical protein [Novacetimonas hansenii]WEQ58619.1 hypothetical protein LV563_12360 [Novacetimonas hansenii]
MAFIFVDKELLEKVQPILAAKGMTVQEVCRDALEYILINGNLPVIKEPLSDEDKELLSEAYRVMANPGEITRVSMDKILDV